ncbi:MAG: hypothetical protein JWO94_3230 [Verrucomicrobiaceae bacterium]|nr:hypothetical protein [Verrucomicrobiaceae bacterium]
MIRLVTVLLAITSLSAQARVGETLKECETRYGPVVEHLKPTLESSDKDAYTFSKNSVTVLAEFREGKVWRIAYNKVGMHLSEVETLLAANATNGPWSTALKVSGQEIRTSADHQRIAVFTPGKRPEATFTLVIATRDYAAANRTVYESKLATIPALLQRRGDGRPLKDF